jgi:hypothetical protein
VPATCAAASRLDRCRKQIARKGVSESEEHLAEYAERKMVERCMTAYKGGDLHLLKPFSYKA